MEEQQQLFREPYSDRGEVAIGVEHSKNPTRGHQIVLSFLMQVAWIGIPVDTALQCAKTLHDYATSMPEPAPFDDFGRGDAPMQVEADPERNAVVLVMRMPAHTATIGRYGALRLSKQIWDAAQQLRTKEQGT